MTAETIATTAPFSVTFPVAFTPEWSRIDGISVEGSTVTVDPGRYFFRYENPSWIVVDWDLVRTELLEHPQESADQALEQRVLEFIREHGRMTTSSAEVLTIAWEVAQYLYPADLTVPGMEVTERQLTALREATTLMALNRVEDTGHISNVGPCWFFPIATGVVFGFTEEEGRDVDEVYHGGFFNEDRRRAAVLAHAALGGRLVHGCQASADMRGGSVVPYGVDIARFSSTLAETLVDEWMAAVADMGR